MHAGERRRSIRLRFPKRWWARLALGGAVVAAVTAPLAWASHTFSDVPTTSPHHTDVTNIKNAGITGGCNPPSNTLYCPSDPVRRDQMASFLGRGLGRIASEQVNPAAIPPDLTEVGDVNIVVPGLAGGQQLVYLQATFTAFETVSAPCYFGIRLHDGSSPTSPAIHQAFDRFPIAGYNQETFTISDVILETSGSHDYALRARTEMKGPAL